ncbi:MAG: BatD family protein [Gemmatimonadota bacterium]
MSPGALLLALGLLLPPQEPGTATAQLRVGATLVPTELHVGETAVLRITVEGPAGDAPVVRMPTPPLGLQLRGTQTQFRGSGAGTRRLFVRELLLEAVTPGTYTLPAATIQVGDQIRRTAVLSLTVRPRPPSQPGGAEEVLLRMTAEPDTVYVGQEVRLRTEALFPADLRLRQARPAVLEPPDAAGFWSYDLPRPAGSTVRVEEGRRYETETFVRSYFPLEAGTYQLEGARLTYEVRRGFLGDPLPGEATAAPVRVVVLPLPDSGRPAEFAGAVGRYGVSARLRPTTVGVGESAELVVEVTGQGNVKALPPPVLPSLEGVEAHALEEETELELTGNAVRGTKRFRWALIPGAGGRVSIDGVALPFFDPEARSYDVARAAPLDLTVVPSSGSQGVLPALLDRPRPRLLTWVWSPWFLTLQLTPLLLVGGALLLRARRRRAAAVVQPPRLPDNASLAEVERVLRQAVATTTGVEPTAAPAELGRALARSGAGADIADAVVDLLQRVERARYAPGGEGEDAALAGAAAGILARLPLPERAPRSRHGAVAGALLAILLAAPGPAQGPDAFGAGVAAYEAARWDEALRHFEHHLVYHPEDAAGWFNAGLAQARAGRHGHAVHAWVRATRLAPRLDAPRAALRAVGAGEALSLATPRLPVRRHEALLAAAAAWLLAGSLAALGVLVSGSRMLRGAAGAAGAAVLALGAAAAAPAPAGVVVVVEDSTSVHAAPVSRAEVLGRLGPGATVRVVERRADWVRVRPSQGVEGWIPAAAAPPLDG